MANQVFENGHDSYSSEVDGMPVGVHFYFLDKSLFGLSNINLAPVTQSGQVLSFLYMPFLTRRDIDIIEIPYNQGKYGSVDPAEPDPFKKTKQVYVYKVRDSAIASEKVLGHVKKYMNKFWGRSTEYRWYNESKLFQFPYQYISITDYMNAPLIIQPHLFPVPTDDFTVSVRQQISFNGGYTIFAKGYKGDYLGNMEGIMSSASLELPTGSSAYSQFMANSKSQFLASNHIASRNESLARYTTNKQAQMGYASANMQYNAQLQAGNISAMGTLFGGIGGGLFGLLGAGVNAGMGLASNRLQANTSRNISNMQTSMMQQIGNMQNSVNKKNRIDQSLAFVSDLVSAPRNISLTGGDMLQTISNSRKSVDVLRYDIIDIYKEKIAMYFTMYGYKQNKFIKLSNGSYKTRKYWNYIKTINANIQSTKLPKDITDQIASIFDAGITFWHYENMNSLEKKPITKGGESSTVKNLKMYEYNRLDNVENNIIYPGSNIVLPEGNTPPDQGLEKYVPPTPPGGGQP